MKNKETLEEACKRIKKELDYSEFDYTSFKLGAKWQAQRMYSEEDLREAFIAGGNSQIEEDDGYGSAYMEYMEEWFEQFKKK
jgi:hypothetical protein